MRECRRDGGVDEHELAAVEETAERSARTYPPSFRGAGEPANPESITTTGSMDSGRFAR